MHFRINNNRTGGEKRRKSEGWMNEEGESGLDDHARADEEEMQRAGGLQHAEDLNRWNMICHPAGRNAWIGYSSRLAYA